MVARSDAKCENCRKQKRKCLPADRTWDETLQQPCEHCFKGDRPCGPNVSKFESSHTETGRKRKREHNLEPTQLHEQRQPSAVSTLGTSVPVSHAENFTAAIDAQTSPRTGVYSVPNPPDAASQSAIIRRGIPPNVAKLLGEVDILLFDYQYINHPSDSIQLLEKGESENEPSNATEAQSLVNEVLGIAICSRLESILKQVTEETCSAECELLFVEDRMRRFQRLAKSSVSRKALLAINIETVDKKIALVRGSRECCEEHMECSSKGTATHSRLSFLRKEKKDLMQLRQSVSRDGSPGPSTDTSPSVDPTVHRESDVASPGECQPSLLSMSAISAVIAARCPKKNLRHTSSYFPSLHANILFSLEDEARAAIESTPNCGRILDFFKRNIVHVAAHADRVSLLPPELLRVELDKADEYHMTPPMIAAMHGHVESYKLLVEAGFSHAKLHPSGRNQLSIAARCGRRKLVQHLITEKLFEIDDTASAEGSSRNNRSICSPLHDAIESGDEFICQILINAGADPRRRFDGRFQDQDALTFAEQKSKYFLGPILRELVSSRNESHLPATADGSLPPYVAEGITEDEIEAYTQNNPGINFQAPPTPYGLNHDLDGEYWQENQHHLRYN